MVVGQGILKPDLPRLLMHNAAGLRKYINSRIPTRLQSVLATDDVVQEVWTSAFKAHAEFTEKGPHSFDRWLSTLADRRIIDGIRKAEATKRGGKFRIRHAGSHATSCEDLLAKVQSPCRTPSSEVRASEAHSAVTIALSSLADDYRQVITLRHFEGKSQAEIASTMQRSPAAINSLLHRGMRQLRCQLSGPGGLLSSIIPGEDATQGKRNDRQQ